MKHDETAVRYWAAHELLQEIYRSPYLETRSADGRVVDADGMVWTGLFATSTMKKPPKPKPPKGDDAALEEKQAAHEEALKRWRRECKRLAAYKPGDKVMVKAAEPLFKELARPYSAPFFLDAPDPDSLPRGRIALFVSARLDGRKYPRTGETATSALAKRVNAALEPLGLDAEGNWRPSELHEALLATADKQAGAGGFPKFADAYAAACAGGRPERQRREEKPPW